MNYAEVINRVAREFGIFLVRGYSHWNCFAERDRELFPIREKRLDRLIETEILAPLEGRRCLCLGRIFCSAGPFFMVSPDALIHRIKARRSGVPLEFLNGELLFMSQAFGQARRDSTLRREPRRNEK